MVRGDDDKKQRVIEWLCTPKRDRDPQTQEELCRRLHISNNAIAKWKRDSEFLKAWEAYYLQTVGSPERKQALMDTLFRTGSDADDPRHVTAAKTYLEIAEGLRPVPGTTTIIVRPVAEWTDEQIDAAIARHAENERHLRLVQDEGA